MPRTWNKKESSESKGSDTSRNSDRQQQDDPVDFKDVNPPVRIKKPTGTGFVEVARRQAVGKNDGKVRFEFFTIVPGYTTKDGTVQFNKKSPSWNPSMTKDIIEALESMVTDDEAKAFGWTE